MDCHLIYLIFLKKNVNQIKGGKYDIGMLGSVFACLALDFFVVDSV